MAASAATMSIGSIAPAPALPQVETFLDRFRESSAGQGSENTSAAEHGAAVGSAFLLKMDDAWLREVDLVQARNTIVSFNDVIPRKAEPSQPRRLEWSLRRPLSHRTWFDPAPAFNRLDEETAQFVDEYHLADGVAWLRTVTPYVFNGADFEIDLLPAEEGEGNLLGLRVYSAFPSSEFRERRHRLCEAMLAAGHRTLYEVISVFQRRVASSGLQVFSWYCSLSTE